MPTYSYQCYNCNYSFSRFLKMNEHLEPEKEECPNCHFYFVKQTINNSSQIIDPYALGRIKPSEDWRYLLKEIKRKNPGSNINDR